MKLLVKLLHRYTGLVIPAVALAAALCIGPLKGGIIRADKAGANKAGANKAGVESPARRPQIRPFVGDFETGDLSAWSHREGARPDSIQVVAHPVRRGRYAARFTVRPGERVSNGNRAELTWDNREPPGSESWYLGVF